MSLTTYPRQDLYESTLLSDIGAGDTSITLNDAPSFTLAAGQSCYLHVDYDVTAKYEPMLITAISGATLTVTRGVARYEGGASSATTHSAGASVRMSVGWMDFSKIKDELANKLDSTGGVCTTPLQDTVYASLAALQAAIPTPANGRSAYCTLEGQAYDSAGGVWVARATGVNPNASDTVAGKIELATNAEMGSGTSIGGSGARLVPPNDQLVNASSGAGDANKIATLDATGKYAAGFIPTITPSMSSFGGKTTTLGTYGETITANQLLYKSSSDFKWYKVNSYTLSPSLQYGLAMEAGNAGDTKLVLLEGDVASFGSYANINPSWAISATGYDMKIGQGGGGGVNRYCFAQKFSNSGQAECYISTITYRAKRTGSPANKLIGKVTFSSRNDNTGAVPGVYPDGSSTTTGVAGATIAYTALAAGSATENYADYTITVNKTIPAGADFWVVFTCLGNDVANYWNIEAQNATPYGLQVLAGGAWGATIYRASLSITTASTSPIGYSLTYNGSPGGMDIRKTNWSKVMGYVKSATDIYFCPNQKYSERKQADHLAYYGAAGGGLAVADITGLNMTPSVIRYKNCTAIPGASTTFVFEHLINNEVTYSTGKPVTTFNQWSPSAAGTYYPSVLSASTVYVWQKEHGVTFEIPYVTGETTTEFSTNNKKYYLVDIEA